jgi:hypothetical protein
MKQILIALFIAVSFVSSTRPIYADDDKLSKRAISHDGDYDPNYRSAQRIIKKMKLSLYKDPALAGKDDADELYNLSAEGKVTVPSGAVLSAMIAILVESYQDYDGGNGLQMYSDAFKLELGQKLHQ